METIKFVDESKYLVVIGGGEDLDCKVHRETKLLFVEAEQVAQRIDLPFFARMEIVVQDLVMPFADVLRHQFFDVLVHELVLVLLEKVRETLAHPGDLPKGVVLVRYDDGATVLVENVIAP